MIYHEVRSGSQGRKMPKVAMKRLSVRLPDHLLEELKEEANAQGVSFAEASRRRLWRGYNRQISGTAEAAPIGRGQKTMTGPGIRPVR